MSDIKIKVEGAVVDPSRSTSGSSGDAASEEVDDVFHSSLTRMFDAFLRAVDRGTVDARILFIHEFLVQLLKVRMMIARKEILGMDDDELTLIRWVNLDSLMLLSARLILLSARLIL